MKTINAQMPRRETIFSDDRKYRYTLWREWDIDLLTGSNDDLPNASQYVQFIGLNPSTADETKDDPTIRKCVGFAKRWGYGALCMTNIFAYRATDPEAMKKVYHSVGEHNHGNVLRIAKDAGLVVCCWGNHGTHNGHGEWMAGELRDAGIKLMCLRITGAGQPEHPLYVPYATKPMPYQ